MPAHLPIRALTVFSFLLLSTICQAKFRGNAYVYVGPGVCLEGCAPAAGRIAESMGFNVRYAGLNEISERLFKSADVWIQPGGHAIEMAQAMGPEKLQILKNYVYRGGKYLGFCAGAFLADHTVDDAKSIRGLGMIPGESRDYGPVTGKPQMLPIVWRGVVRHLYFEDGPAFDLLGNAEKPDVVAQYPDGSPAVIQFPWGKGRVSISGPHPEAHQNWKESDPDGDDLDLAQEMLTWLISGAR